MGGKTIRKKSILWFFSSKIFEFKVVIGVRSPLLRRSFNIPKD